MKINIYIIDKKGKNELYAPLLNHYQKLIKPWAKLEIFELFNKDLAKNQKSPKEIQKLYTQILTPHLKGGYNIALDPKGELIDSFQFANLLRDRQVINFFIGGAYGFERDFIKQSDKSISFGRITLSHKLIKVVLTEQIFRGLSIINNHPYHK